MSDFDASDDPARAARMRARTPLARIRRALAEGAEPPSLGEIGPTLASIALSSETAVERIAELAQADPAMLVRLLRAANSPAFMTRSGDAVCSVSRAVMLLGYNEAREIALSLPRVDELAEGREHREIVRTEYAHANLAATLARRLLYARHAGIAEEGALVAMLGQSARMLAAIHAPQALVAIQHAAETHGIDPSAAARRSLGIGFEELAQEAVAAWRMPPRVGRALRTAQSLRPREPEHADDWLPLAIACAGAMTDALVRAEPADRARRLADVQRRFGRAIDIDERGIASLLEATTEDARRIDRLAGTPPSTASCASVLESHLAGRTRILLPAPPRSADELNRTLVDSAAPADALALIDTVADAGRFESTVAGAGRAESTALLGSALQAIENLLSAHAAGLAPVLSVALAGIQRGMDYATVAYFGRDDATATFRPRMAIGADLDDLRDTVTMSTANGRDVLHAALGRGVDLHIGDTGADNIRGRLPPWFGAAFPRTRSFLVLPIRVDDRPIGFILACREQPDPAGPTPDELSRIRTLRNRIAVLQLSGIPEFG